MLWKFLQANREELIARCRAKVSARRAPRASEAELENGIPLFLQQLVDMLRADLGTTPPPMMTSAAQHGEELLQQGFTVAQVIHDYGDLCQSITELAFETHAPVTAEEFGALNRCLDDAIAAAVTEYARQRDHLLEDESFHNAELRVGFLIHELRNMLNTATLSFEMIKRGSVALHGTTSALHERALGGLRSLVDGALAEIRLSTGVQRQRIGLADFIAEVESAATLEAAVYAIRLNVGPVDAALAVEADRQVLAAVLANLLQNAFKFTREKGGADVTLRVRQTAGRVYIDVEDECGGLPWQSGEMPQPFEQRGEDKSGLGLGLAICRRGVEANDGRLHVRDMPGQGCVFSVELARTLVAQN